MSQLAAAAAPMETAAGVARVSIVVPCRNEAKYIRKLLDSVIAQDLTGIDWELLIADGMSDDGTREILAEYHARLPQIRLIDNPGRAVSPGLNRAIADAKGDIILRMDAHTEYAPNYVKKCVEVLKSTGAANVGGPALARSEGYWGRAIATAYRSPFACGGARFHNPNFEGFVDTVPYGCWWRHQLQEVGGFDERLVRNQDDELNLRISRQGGKIWQTPEIVSWYHPRSTLRALYRQYFQYGFWKVAVIQKHKLPASWRHMIPVLWVIFHFASILTVAATELLGRRDLTTLAASLWFVGIAAYLGVSLLAAVKAAREDGWELLPALPVAFGVYHFSYGFGFLCGLLYWPFANSKGGSDAPRGFTALSR
jgi:succinoglycan biosynthesis protein ExoA